MGKLKLIDISKRYEDSFELKDINFTIKSKEILCLLGPSGCGKTTLLQLIAGLQFPDKGKVLLDNKDMSKISPHLRGFRMMFQEFALFPHKNVFENIAFGLRVQKQSKDQIQERVNQMLAITGLKGFGSRDIRTLSGGERQRVALARTLAPGHNLLLLDEPLGSLDRQMREKLIIDLSRILIKIDAPAIVVTHDHNEGFALADKIAVMDNGSIQQIDTPENLYSRPANPLVADFLGFKNLIDATVKTPGIADTKIGSFYTKDKTAFLDKKAKVLLHPRGAKLMMGQNEPDRSNNIIDGRVKYRLFQGFCYHTGIETKAGIQLFFDLDARPAPPKPGENISIYIDPLEVILLPN